MKRYAVLLLCLLIALPGLGPLEPPAPAGTQVALTPTPLPPPLPPPRPPPRPPAPTPPLARIAPEPDLATTVAHPPGAVQQLPFTLALDHGAAPARLAHALQIALERDGYEVCLVGVADQAELYIGYDPPAGYHLLPLTTTHFVPVVSYWLPVTEVAYADLERIWRGEVQVWADLGWATTEAIVPLALRSDPPPPAGPADPLLPDTAALVAALNDTPGGLALVSLEQLDVRLRTLRVDGRDLLLETDRPPDDPLVRQLVVAIAPDAPAAAAGWAREVAAQQQVTPPGPAITVVIAGDILPGRLVGRLLASWGDYTRAFARVSETLRAADLTIADLEGALSNQIVPPEEPQTLRFVGSGRFVEGLLYAGIDGVSLANNHSMDFGRLGMSHTLALLSAAGIPSFGAGMDLDQARRPAILEVHGVRFAFLGYDAVSYYYAAGEGYAGTAPADPALIAADIAAAHAQADVVIPYFHWGDEYTHQANWLQQELAHRAVEAGATIVVGSHPHWVQGLEYYQGVPIVYSLGNFVFDQGLSLETQQGLILHLTFWGPRLVGLRLQATQIEGYYQPFILLAAKAQQVYNQVQRFSPSWTHEKGDQP